MLLKHTLWDYIANTQESLDQHEELHKKFEELTSNGFEIVHYEEKKQEPDRFYVTMILGTLSEATEVVKFLKG